MNLFDFIAIPVSILVGLSLTQILSGICALLRVAPHVKFFFPYTALLLLAVIVQLQYWWQMWMWRRAPHSWNVGKFLLVLLHPMVLFLIANLAIPPIDIAALSRRDVVDLEAYYFAIRPIAFGLGASLPMLYYLTDRLLGTLDPTKNYFRAGFFVLCVALAIAPHKTFHYIATTIIVVAFILFIAFVNDDVPRIAGMPSNSPLFLTAYRKAKMAKRASWKASVSVMPTRDLARHRRPRRR